MNDPRERLLKDRIVFLGEAIDDAVATATIASLLYLESRSRADITLYINSPGGMVSAGSAIIDTMDKNRCDIVTVCIGQASGEALRLLAHGTHGKRFALPHARVAFTPLESGATDQKTLLHLQRLRRMVAEGLQKDSRMAIDDIRVAMDTRRSVSATEAVTLGLIDKVVQRR